MTNIPIYRAKKIDSEEYAEGWLKTCTDTGVILWIQTRQWIDCQIDETTLAIHFPDMIDSEGNKIFASLSEDGKGGSITKGLNSEYEWDNKISDGSWLQVVHINTLSQRSYHRDMFDPSEQKVIGIQK